MPTQSQPKPRSKAISSTPNAYDDRQRPPATKFVPVGGKVWTSEQPRDIRYWEWLHNVLEPELIEARDQFFMGMLLPLGLVHGEAFAPTEAQRKVLTDAAVVGDLMGRLTAYSKRQCHLSPKLDR